MKNKILLILLILSVFSHARALTSYYYSAQFPDGTPQTNYFTLQVWPPAAQGITIYGTNIIFGPYTFTNTPNASGFYSNSISPNTYKLQVPAINLAAFVTIPDTTNYIALATYMTNSPIVSGGIGGYAFVTNYLGYVPATNNPGTNTIVFVSAVSGITNASGYVTNLSVTLTTNTINYQIR
jgi:hypothetical protein